MKVLLALLLMVFGLYSMFAAFWGSFFTGAMSLGGSGKLLTKANVIGVLGGACFVGGLLWLLAIVF